MKNNRIYGFSYADEGIIPFAIVFFDGLYHFFCGIKGEKGVYIAKSSDLFSFESPSLFLDIDITGGGSAFVKNGKIYFVFSLKSGHVNMATLDILGAIQIFPLPIIGKKGLYDPKIFHDGENFYLLARNKKADIFLYRSTNMISFNLCAELTLPNVNRVSCPSLHKVGENWVLIYAAENIVYTQNVIFRGEDGVLVLDGKAVFLDDLSSPRIAALSDGRTVMAGTFEGRLILRELWVKNGEIHLYPLAELKSRSIIQTSKSFELKNKYELEIETDGDFAADISLISQDLNECRIMFDENTTYPKYIYLNFEYSKMLLSTGSPVAKLVLKDVAFNEVVDLEIFAIKDNIEVYNKRQGIVLTGNNPFSGSYEKSFFIRSNKPFSCKINLYITK